jgi:hypothetical protein
VSASHCATRWNILIAEDVKARRPRPSAIKAEDDKRQPRPIPDHRYRAAIIDEAKREAEAEANV